MKALDWPPFAGTLGGRLPLLTYQHGLVTVGGTLEASAFDGSVQVAGLRITNPLGLVPEIEADIHLRSLDLEQVTRAGELIASYLHRALPGRVHQAILARWKRQSQTRR